MRSQLTHQLRSVLAIVTVVGGMLLLTISPARASTPTVTVAGQLRGGDQGFVAGTYTLSRVSTGTGQRIDASGNVTTPGGGRAVVLCLSSVPFTSRVTDFNNDPRCVPGTANSNGSVVSATAPVPTNLESSSVYVQFRIRAQDPDGTFRNTYAGWQPPNRGDDQYGNVEIPPPDESSTTTTSTSTTTSSPTTSSSTTSSTQPTTTSSTTSSTQPTTTSSTTSSTQPTTTSSTTSLTQPTTSTTTGDSTTTTTGDSTTTTDLEVLPTSVVRQPTTVVRRPPIARAGADSLTMTAMGLLAVVAGALLLTLEARLRLRRD